MKEFLGHMKLLLPFYLVLVFYCIFHFCMHGWYPVFILLLAPVVPTLIKKYIIDRINNRKQF